MFTPMSISVILWDNHTSLCLVVRKSSNVAFIDSSVISFAYSVCSGTYWAFFMHVYPGKQQVRYSLGLDSNDSGTWSLVFETVCFHMLRFHQHIQPLCHVVFPYHVFSRKLYLRWLIVNLILLVESFVTYRTKNHRILIIHRVVLAVLVAFLFLIWIVLWVLHMHVSVCHTLVHMPA